MTYYPKTCVDIRELNTYLLTYDRYKIYALKCRDRGFKPKPLSIWKQMQHTPKMPKIEIYQMPVKRYKEKAIDGTRRD